MNRIKPYRKQALRGLLVGLLCMSTYVQAQVAVIVNPSITDAVDEKTVRNIYLGKIKTFPNGDVVLPLHQVKGNDSRADFLATLLNKSEANLKAYWTKYVFTGKGSPPQEVENDDQMKALVKDNPATIGYIDAVHLDDTVKVLFTF